MSAKDLLVRFPADFSNYAHTAAILIKLSRATVCCRFPKLFRLSFKLGRIVQDMKLNKTRVRYILC